MVKLCHGFFGRHATAIKIQGLFQKNFTKHEQLILFEWNVGDHASPSKQLLIEVLNNHFSARGLTCFASIGMAHEKMYCPQIRLSERGQ